MANEITAVNGIALTSIEKVNGKTDDNIEKLNGREFVGVVYPVATGGTITTDGDYKVHTFNSSGTFTVTTAGTTGVEYLVVGGGGGEKGSGQKGGGAKGGGKEIGRAHV